MKTTWLRGKSFFVASKSAGRERILRDPDWTAELVRDVHGARGVDVSMHLSLFLSLKFSGRMLFMHLDCLRSHVLKKYYFSYHLQSMSSKIILPSFFFGGLFYYPFPHDRGVRLDLIRLFLFLQWCVRLLLAPIC